MAQQTMNLWDSGFDGSFGGQSLKPLFTVSDLTNWSEVHRWAKQAFQLSMMKNEDRIRQIQRHMALYNGIHFQEQHAREETARSTTTQTYSGGPGPAPKTPRVVLNHLYDLTESRIARLARFNPFVTVNPAKSTDYEDKLAAKTIKDLIDFLHYDNHLDQLFITIDRINAVCGECYLFIEWDPDKGPIHPEAQKPEAFTPKKQNGQPETNALGEMLHVEQPDIHVGDVCFTPVRPDMMYLDPRDNFDECDWIIRERVDDADKLKRKYKKDVTPGVQQEVYKIDFDFYNQNLKRQENLVTYYELWHKRTKWVKEGRKIVFTANQILENKPIPYEHGEFPCERITDIDSPGRLYGESNYKNAKQLNTIINVLNTMILRNQVLCAHPKWVAPAGQVKKEDLGNDVTICWYTGATPPQLVSTNPTPQEVFGYEEKMTEKMQQFMGVFGVSRGQPPPGIKAGIALQFLEEQENERFNADILKRNDFIRRVWEKALLVTKEYYQDDDERIIKIFGKNQNYHIKHFDVTQLMGDFDIRIQNSTALPQSKAARTQYLIDLSEKFPGMIPQEQLVQMLDLGNSPEFVNQATIAVDSAESENDDLLSGKKVGAPESYEMHIQHWPVHVRALQDRAFKEMEDEKIKEAMIDHIRAHEYEMQKIAGANPAFGQALMSLQQFPMFASRPIPPPMPMEQPGQGGPPPGLPGLPPGMMPHGQPPGHKGPPAAPPMSQSIGKMMQAQTRGVQPQANLQ